MASSNTHSSEQYIMLTACRNEAKFIGDTVRSVITQTRKPLVWLILDDGSTDGTADVVREAAKGCDWVRVHRLEPRVGRSFGAQYRAIMKGYGMLQNEPFAYVGVLDADITFPSSDYFAKLLAEFEMDSQLGLAGGEVLERENGVFKPRRGNVEWSVPGGIQTFRREVFDAIQGYVPLEYGGSDGLAVVMTKMKGWKVRSVSGLSVHHHRPSSSADGVLKGAFRRGLMDAAFGYDPVFMVAKCVRRLPFKPLVAGSICSLAGYVTYKLRGGRPVIPADALEYFRREQRARLGRVFGKRTTAQA